MKYLLMVLILVVAGYLAWQQFKPVPPPPPPPPPPPVTAPPAPVISAEELAKITKSTNDLDPMVRWEAITFLDKMKVPDTFPIMFDKLHKDPDLDLRLKVITLLGQRGGPKTITVPNQNDPLNPTAVLAASSADNLSSQIAQHLIWATNDPEPDVRIAAIKALDEIGDYSAASALTESLKDSDERVRLQALRTLNSLQDKKVAILEAERRRQEEARRQAAEAAKNR
ncbi:MAG: HEAT repeat domain-containing protein [Elusimicrobiota bacterium]|jgi:HEAT repeat protein